jgi:histidyl-tRNA synthetase
MAASLQAVRGMNDVLPDEATLWQRFEDTARFVFELLRIPAPARADRRDDAAVRARHREHTDVVEHEMYTFEDKLNGDSLTLRRRRPRASSAQPSSTASSTNGRSAYGPAGRCSATSGRRRAAIGSSPARRRSARLRRPRRRCRADVMLARLWHALGLSDVRLAINSIGDAGERRAHRDALIAHFEQHAGLLDDDGRRRLHANPLRILDSKHPPLQDVIAAAPRLVDGLGADSRAHFDALRGLLDEAGISYVVDPRLVRGLDYYNRTVFEWVTEALGAQGTVAGGGRYDGLFEALGGKPTPACGFAIGVERMILLMEAQGAAHPAGPDGYIVHAGERAAALARRVAETLRDHGACVVLHAGGGSFKSQMKKADASGARLALIIGDDEAASDTVAIKTLRSGGDQISVPVKDLPARFAALNVSKDEYGCL